MLELNRELVSGILESLEYANELNDINPNLEIPIAFLSPAISVMKYRTAIQDWESSLTWYKFFFASVDVVEKEKIIDGVKMLELLNKFDVFMLDRIMETCMNELGCTEEYILENESVLIQYLEKYMDMGRIKINIPFVSSYSEELELFFDEDVANMFIIDLFNDGGEEYVLDFNIDSKGQIDIWYYLDFSNEYRFDHVDYYKLEKRFMNLLKKEAV